MTENVIKNGIKIDDIKRALQSGNTDKAILLSQQALDKQDNAQEKVELLYLFHAICVGEIMLEPCYNNIILT